MREERRLRVCEDRLMRCLFDPKSEGVRSEWRKLHYWELNDLYTSPNIYRVIRSRRMKWAGMQRLWVREEERTGFLWGT